MTGRTLFQGAEAVITEHTLRGRPVVRKHRPAKTYRHSELDRKLRLRRIRAEARLLSLARRHGVTTPYVLACDRASMDLVLERVDGPTLDDLAAGQVPWRAFGAQIGRLHEAGIVHGDATPRNALLHDGRVVLIDFGLAERSQEPEDQGVDLVLVQRALETLDPDGAATWYSDFLEGYRSARHAPEAAVERATVIRSRARYV